jgi:Mn2+/Fe2+ NRAMP family transporter
MKKILGITLGIMTALGGFVDLGQIVFTMQAGAVFGYQLLWSVVLGTIGIIVYMEMCGRIAVVTGQPVFAIVRSRLGYRLGLTTLIASNLLNLITCAAELGGIATVLHLLTGWPERLLLVSSTLILGAIVLLLKFKWIERTFGLAGILMVVFAVSAVLLKPDWRKVGKGLLPFSSHVDPHQSALYAFFAVGIFSALLMAYEVHFYSSGAIEENWKPKDLGENFMVASLGSVLGSLLTAALLVLGAMVLLPTHIYPELLSTTILAGSLPFAEKGLTLALLGVLATLAGAAIETALSGGYNLCQFFRRPWRKTQPPNKVRLYTTTWIAILLVALVIVATGIRPLLLVNISVVFGMVVLPLTYYPILRLAGDKKIMGKHVNSRFDDFLGIVFLLLITVAAVAAIPLMIITHSGQP